MPATADKPKEEAFVSAQKLIAKSPLTIQIRKEFYYQMMDMTFCQRFALDKEILARLCNYGGCL